jgi:hypothetical protein
MFHTHKNRLFLRHKLSKLSMPSISSLLLYKEIFAFLSKWFDFSMAPMGYPALPSLRLLWSAWCAVDAWSHVEGSYIVFHVICWHPIVNKRKLLIKLANQNLKRSNLYAQSFINQQLVFRMHRFERTIHTIIINNLQEWFTTCLAQ